MSNVGQSPTPLTKAISQWSRDDQTASTAITDIGALIGKRLFLCRAESRAAKSGPRFSPEQRRRMDGFIQLNLAKHFSVPQLARIVALSVPHFATLCRNTTESRRWNMSGSAGYGKPMRWCGPAAIVAAKSPASVASTTAATSTGSSKKSSCIRWPRCWGCAHETEI